MSAMVATEREDGTSGIEAWNHDAGPIYKVWIVAEGVRRFIPRDFESRAAAEGFLDELNRQEPGPVVGGRTSRLSISEIRDELHRRSRIKLQQAADSQIARDRDRMNRCDGAVAEIDAILKWLDQATA